MNAFTDLDEAVEAICRFVQSLPEGALPKSAWGPKEVLAHLVFYHEVYVAQAQATLAGKPIEPLQGTYRDLNAQAAVQSRGTSLGELARRLRAANRQLGALYAACNPDLVIIPIKIGVRPFTLARLVPEVAAHVRNHHRQLRKELRAAARVAPG